MCADDEKAVIRNCITSLRSNIVRGLRAGQISTNEVCLQALPSSLLTMLG